MFRNPWRLLRSDKCPVRSRPAALRKSPHYRPAFELLETRLAPATHTWTGAASNLWSSPANWMGGVPTISEQNVALTFPAGAANTTNTNDILGLNIKTITFSANGYSISGSLITLTDSISLDSAVTGTVAYDLDTSLGGAFPGGPTARVDNTGATLVIGANLSGTVGFEFGGPGNLVLAGNNTFAGPFNLAAGTVIGGNDHAFGGRRRDSTVQSKPYCGQ